MYGDAVSRFRDMLVRFRDVMAIGTEMWWIGQRHGG